MLSKSGTSRFNVPMTQLPRLAAHILRQAGGDRSRLHPSARLDVGNAPNCAENRRIAPRIAIGGRRAERGSGGGRCGGGAHGDHDDFGARRPRRPMIQLYRDVLLSVYADDMYTLLTRIRYYIRSNLYTAYVPRSACQHASSIVVGSSSSTRLIK